MALPVSHQNPLKSLNYRVSRSVKLVDAKCIICGSDSNIEMHHIKGIKYLKGMSVHSIMVRSLNRIQVPLCAFHHRMAHRNSLNSLLDKERVDE